MTTNWQFVLDRGRVECSPLGYWPIDIPLPSAEECLVAEQRHRKERLDWEARTGEPDWTDGGLCLTFMMATYNPLIWLPYFFPDRKEEFDKQFASDLAAFKLPDETTT